MKALDYLYRMKQLNEEMGCEAININEAIKELEEFEEYKTNYQDAKQRLDSTVITLAVLKNENNLLVKTLMKMSEEITQLRKENNSVFKKCTDE